MTFFSVAAFRQQRLSSRAFLPPAASTGSRNVTDLSTADVIFFAAMQEDLEKEDAVEQADSSPEQAAPAPPGLGLWWAVKRELRKPASRAAGEVGERSLLRIELRFFFTFSFLFFLSGGGGGGGGSGDLAGRILSVVRMGFSRFGWRAPTDSASEEENPPKLELSEELDVVAAAVERK